MAETPTKKPKRPVEEVRAELLKSEETKQLAQTLGIGLEDYVEKVLAYYQDPSKEPMIYLAPEDQLRAAGANPPQEKEIMEWLQKVERGEIDLRPKHLKDEFSGPQKAKGPGGALRDQVTQQAKKKP